MFVKMITIAEKPNPIIIPMKRLSNFENFSIIYSLYVLDIKNDSCYKSSDEVYSGNKAERIGNFISQRHFVFLFVDLNVFSNS
jgi:hypothetical protein